MSDAETECHIVAFDIYYNYHITRVHIRQGISILELILLSSSGNVKKVKIFHSTVDYVF